MKNSIRNKLRLIAANTMMAAVALSAGTLTASADTPPALQKFSQSELESVTKPIENLLKNVLNVLIPLVAAVGAIFCISLGLKYSKAEEPQDREKAKQHLKSAIIGFVLIFVLIVALRIATPIFVKWMNTNSPKA